MRTAHPLSRLLVYAGLACAAAITIAPLLWLALNAFKTTEDISSGTFFTTEKGWTTENFARLFPSDPHAAIDITKKPSVNFTRFMVNSLFISGSITLLQLFFSSLGGFALAKYRFKGQGVLTVIMLATFMIPGPVLLAPQYELIYNLGLMDHRGGLIVTSMVGAFGIFLFRQAMRTVPDELIEAARIDGCSEFGLYWNIALPVVRPMVGAFCLITFMGTWNSFLWPQIILQSQDLFTLPIAVNQMRGMYGRNDTGLILAATLLSVLPVAVLFTLLQREFISGLTSGAVKG